MPPFFRPWVHGTTSNVQSYHEIYHASSQDHVAAPNHGNKNSEKMSKKGVILGQILNLKFQSFIFCETTYTVSSLNNDVGKPIQEFGKKKIGC